MQRFIRRLNREILVIFCFLLSVTVMGADPSPERQHQIDARAQTFRMLFERGVGGHREWSKTDRSISMAALIKLITEEKVKSPGGSVYVSAIKELGTFIDEPDAVRVLVENIDQPPNPAPIAGGRPLDGETSALALARGGSLVRSRILLSLRGSNTDRQLFLKAHVLVQLDQIANFEDNGVDVTLFRLTRILEKSRALAPEEGGASLEWQHNLERIMELMTHKYFMTTRSDAFPK